MTRRPVQAKPQIRLPQVDKVLREPKLETLAATVRREVLAEAVRRQLASLRAGALGAGKENQPVSAADVAQSVHEQMQSLLDGGIKRVINGTGVILSTNLGRAPLAQSAVDKMARALTSYCNLEFDLIQGKRGERTEQLSLMLSLLTGCQTAIVVNNCASAVMLAVQALAQGKEVIVSRGELIEIGGSFRLPDVIVASGGILREVGTTNRTRLSDYKKAINKKTGLIIKCHRSNYQILGFTEEADAEELSALAKENGIGLAYDLGGGCFVDLKKYDLVPEPTVQATLAAGADLVMFSGDKLLGGPQAGIIAGTGEYVSRLRKCPVYRALRADKVVLALLETVIAQYLLVDGADKLPVFSLAARKSEDLRKRSNLFIGNIESKLRSLEIKAAEMTSTMGGGSLPGETLKSWGLTLRARTGKNGSGSGASDAKLAALLRRGQPPVVATVANGLVMIDLRTIKEEDEDDLARAIIAVDCAIY